MSAGRGVVFGVTKAGTVLSLPISAERIAIQGRSGSGKSCLLRNVILGYAQALGHRVRFVAIDPKVVSLAHLSPRIEKLVVEPGEYLQTIRAVDDLVTRRYARLASLGRSSFGPQDYDSVPLVILVVEEAYSVVSGQVSKEAQKQIMATYATLLTRCRAANVGVIMSSHTYSAEVLPTLARDQLSTRLLLPTASSTVVSMLADPDEAPAHLLSSPGEFYYSDGGGPWMRGKTWETDEEEARSLAASLSGDRGDTGLDWVVDRP